MRTTIKLLAFFIAGLGIGLLIGRTDIFTIFYLIAATGVVTLIYIIGKIAALIAKSKNSIVTNYIGLIALALIFSTVTAFITLHNIIERKQKIAEELIPKLEKYRQQNSVYPTSLNDLGIDNNDMFSYWTDSIRQTYSIRFIRDGWHFSQYDSKTKEWTSGD